MEHGQKFVCSEGHPLSWSIRTSRLVTVQHYIHTVQQNIIIVQCNIITYVFLSSVLRLTFFCCNLLKKSGDLYGTMYNKKTSVSDLNIRSAGGAEGYFKIRSCYGVWNLTFATKMHTCYRFCTWPTSGINCRMEKSGS